MAIQIADLLYVTDDMIYDDPINCVIMVAESERALEIHCLYDFAHKQDSQLDSSVLITVWRVLMEKSVTGLPTE